MPLIREKVWYFSFYFIKISKHPAPPPPTPPLLPSPQTPRTPISPLLVHLLDWKLLNIVFSPNIFSALHIFKEKHFFVTNKKHFLEQLLAWLECHFLLFGNLIYRIFLAIFSMGFCMMKDFWIISIKNIFTISNVSGF